MEIKSILASKVFWVNLVVLAIAVAKLAGVEGMENDPNIPIYAAAVVALANLILRTWFTAEPVTRFSADRGAEAQMKRARKA